MFTPAPADWQPAANDMGGVTVGIIGDSTEGERSVCVINPNLGQSTTLNIRAIAPKVPAGYKLVMKADIKTDIIKNDFGQNAKIEIYPASRRKVNITPLEAWPSSFTLGGKTDGWVKDLKCALIVHEEVSTLLFRLTMKGVGKVYFDNMRMEAERIALPSNTISNTSFSVRAGELSGWELSGDTDLSSLLDFHYNTSPVQGTVRKEQGMLYQDIEALTPEFLKKLAGKEITLKCLARCEKPLTGKVGFEFYGDDPKEPVDTVIALEHVIEGTDPKDLLFSPYQLSKVTTVVPEGLKRVRAFIRFDGGTGARYQITKFKFMGSDPAEDTDAVLATIPEQLRNAPYAVARADFNYVKPVSDKITVSEALFKTDFAGW
ncbi:MAG: hypothetical protein U5N86_13235 [Planctomycetota bacterium]|nr:hypothetical protein [Planctomycetota bacterium]